MERRSDGQTEELRGGERALQVALWLHRTLLAAAGSSACSSALPFTFSGSLPDPFFFFSLARMEDSLSGNGGISSKTVACRDGEEGQSSTPFCQSLTKGGRSSQTPQIKNLFFFYSCLNGKTIEVLPAPLTTREAEKDLGWNKRYETGCS